ncbi:creatininase family protein [Brucellaceae bacterium D45D]
MTKVNLKDMSWAEFRERLADKPVILITLGSQEEQGPHAPMGDYMLVERLAELIAEKSGAIAAPPLPFGYADFFRTVPGGIQLRPETFTAILEDMLCSLLDHGLERILIFNGHTTNGPLIEQVVRKIKREKGIMIPSLNVWRTLPPEIWRKAHGDNAPKARGHGADPLTSIYMHLFPELMRHDLITVPQRKSILGLKTANVRAVEFEGSEVNMPLDITDVTDNGISAGDPALSSAETGRIMVEWLVDYTSRLVSHLRQNSPRVARELEDDCL